MTPMNINVARVEAELTQLLEDFVATFDLERLASISVRRDQNDGTDFRVEPLDDRCAEFWVNYLDGVRWINVYIAENTVLEIPLEGRQYTNKSGIEELTSILKAIVVSGVQEEVWKSNGKIIKSVATLHVEGEVKPVVVNCYNLHHPFASKTKVTITYLPYVRREDAQFSQRGNGS